MPMIDLTLSEGALSDAALDELVEKLTKTLIRGEGAPDNEYVRSLTWCFVDKRPAHAICVGGSKPALPHYRITMTVPEGAPLIHGPLNFGQRQTLCRKATELVLDAEGSDYSFENRRRVWVHIREIKDGYWGAFGDIAQMHDIAAFSMGQTIVNHETDKALKWRGDFDTLKTPETAEA